MMDSVIKLIIGDIEEKRNYKRLMKGVDLLPEDYRLAFRKMQSYMFCVGGTEVDVSVFSDMNIFNDMVELFEASAADGKSVYDMIGADADRFCDELMRAYATEAESIGEKLNREIKDRIGKGV